MRGRMKNYGIVETAYDRRVRSQTPKPVLHVPGFRIESDQCSIWLEILYTSSKAPHASSHIHSLTIEQLRDLNHCIDVYLKETDET